MKLKLDYYLNIIGAFHMIAYLFKDLWNPESYVTECRNKHWFEHKFKVDFGFRPTLIIRYKGCSHKQQPRLR